MKRVRFALFLCLIVVAIGVAAPMRASAGSQPDARVQLAAQRVAQGAFSVCGADQPHNNSAAVYRICRPPWWWIKNGSLVIWAHGYVEPTEPVAIPEDQLCVPDGLCIPDVVNFLGYDFATTSYSKNGLAVQEGIADVVELVDLYTAQYGPPSSVFLVGASEGGIITALSLERYPQIFDAGLATCGPVGDFPSQINYFGDFRAVFDYFFPGLIPGSPVDIPPQLIADWDTYYATVVAPVLLDPANRDLVRQLVQVTGIPYDPYDVRPTVSQSITEVLWYNIVATNDATLVLGGQPFDNTNRVYSGSRDDAALNAGVARYAADPAAMVEMQSRYQTSGNLSSPVVTLHTKLDQQVPYWHENLYLQKTILNGSWPLKHQNYPPPNRYGHCMFSTADVIGAFGLMLTMTIGSQQPNQAHVDALLAELGPDAPLLQLHRIGTAD